MLVMDPTKPPVDEQLPDQAAAAALHADGEYPDDKLTVHILRQAKLSAFPVNYVRPASPDSPDQCGTFALQAEVVHVFVLQGGRWPSMLCSVCHQQLILAIEHL